MTSCADCPYLSNGTRKRPICCREEGIAARLAAAETKIVQRYREALVPVTSRRAARVVALSGSMLATNEGTFTPGAARFAAPLTTEEAAKAAARAVSGFRGT